MISLEQFRRKKKEADIAQRRSGVLVWLYCPTCKTLEYTEIIAPHGRTHKCGTLVKEAEVEVDLRAELTITEFNLKRIDELIEKNSSHRLTKLLSKSLDKALNNLKRSEETYLHRLKLAAGTKLTPYPGTMEDLAEQLPIKKKNSLGLYISEFRYEPEKRFNSEE